MKHVYKRLIFFDIDGTLLHSDRVGAAATRRAMQEVFGTLGGLDAFRFGGKTDLQMLLETLAAHYTPSQILRQMERYDHCLERHMLDIIAAHNVRPCLGAEALLARAQADAETLVGLLTANMPRSAAVKLRQAGYDPSVFQVQAFGAGHDTRAKLAAWAVDEARALFSFDEVLFIGDTPEDIRAARHVGARVIAVAAGGYSLDTLREHQPDWAVASLADTEGLWSFIASA